MAYDRDEYGNTVKVITPRIKCSSCERSGHFLLYLDHNGIERKDSCRCGYCGRWNDLPFIDRVSFKGFPKWITVILGTPILLGHILFIMELVLTGPENAEAMLLAPGFWLVMLIIAINNIGVLGILHLFNKKDKK